jgi:hypothetical protein
MFFGERAIQIVADAKILEAINEGKFDGLPGFGKPFSFDPFDHDPNWWIRDKIKRERLGQILASYHVNW